MNIHTNIQEMWYYAGSQDPDVFNLKCPNWELNPGNLRLQADTQPH